MAVMLCVLQVMDFLLVVVRLRLIMSGDVELNPGPMDQGGWTIRVHAYTYVCVWVCACQSLANKRIKKLMTMYSVDSLLYISLVPRLPSLFFVKAGKPGRQSHVQYVTSHMPLNRFAQMQVYVCDFISQVLLLFMCNN